MFIQIIEARTSDPEGIRRLGERWQEELRPGAAGYLGVTSGVTADGRSIAVVRFESEAAARANSARPEQGAWFEEMAKYFEGTPAFHESSDIEEWRGGSDEAGFVQVMKVTGADRAKIADLDGLFQRYADLRPDLLGTVRAWTGPDSFIETAYFTSEAEARSGEAADLPEELADGLAELAAMGSIEYFDLVAPQLA